MPDYRPAANRRSVGVPNSLFSGFDANLDLQLNAGEIHKPSTSPERTRIIDERATLKPPSYAPSLKSQVKPRLSHSRLPFTRASSTLDITSSSARPAAPKKSKTFSLFNLFSKPKVEKARGYHEATPTLPPSRPRSPPTLSVPVRPSTQLSHRSTTPVPPIPHEGSRPPPIPERSPSRTSIRSNSTVKSRVNRPRPSDAGHRLDAHWEPPPLFQAYPQAVKHMVTEISGSADEKINRTIREEIKPKSNRFSGFFGKATTRFETPSPAQKLRERRIFMLVTSGHVLQYALDGPSDRLPERVLRLGKQSVAFASDLVPGKPFVLQVLQSAENKAHIETDKSFLSKLTSQSVAPRTVTSLLLIFEEPTDLNTWMIVVRREIEKLGGRKFSCSTVRTQPDNLDTMSISSQRYRGLQRTMSMKSNRSNKAPSIVSIPSLPTSPLMYTTSPVLPSESSTAFTSGSEWSSAGSRNGRSERSSEGTSYTENPSFDTQTSGEEPPMPLLSKYNSAGARKDASPEFNMHDFLTPQPTSPHPDDDYMSSHYESQSVLRKADVTDAQEQVPRPSSRASERFQRQLQIKTAQPTSVTRGYRGWSPNAAPRYPPLPPLPASPTTPTIEITRPLHIRRISQNSATAATPEPPVAQQQQSPIDSPMTPLTRQKSSPTLPHALLATPASNATTPGSGKRSRPTSAIRNSSSPIPLRTSELYLSTPPSFLPRSPMSLSTPLTPPSPDLHPLRRPASLPVRADPVPFLASVRPNGFVLSSSPGSSAGSGGSVRISPPGSRGSPSSGMTLTPREKAYQRASIQVPIVRPGTIRRDGRGGEAGPGGVKLRSRKSAPLLSLEVARPPMSGPPPSKALPAVPVA